MVKNEMTEILKIALEEKSLEQKLIEANSEDVLKAGEKFTISDEKTASWVVGKIAMWQNEVERRKKQAEEYIKDAENTLERLMYLFGAALASYTQKQLENENSNKKSLKLATGTVGFRQTPDRFEVVDKDAYIRWCDANKVDGYTVETRCVVTPAKEYYEKTGKLPDGVERIEGLLKFYIK